MYTDCGPCKLRKIYGFHDEDGAAQVTPLRTLPILNVPIAVI